MIDGSTINEQTTISLYGAIAFAVGSGAWGLALNRKLSRIETRLAHMEQANTDYVRRADMLSWVLRLVRANRGKDIEIPDFPDSQGNGSFGRDE